MLALMASPQLVKNVHRTTELRDHDIRHLVHLQPMEVTLLTGCKDPHYAFGLATALSTAGVFTNIIGSEAEDTREFHSHPNISFHHLRRNRRAEQTAGGKLLGWLRYYWALFQYMVSTRGQLIHILWNNKFEMFDRTILMFGYKLLGKTVVRTAHNVNQARRDENDSILNRLTLKVQYRFSDRIFVHTQQMKQQLCAEFGIKPETVTVIPYGMNNAIRNTNLSCRDAKQKLGVKDTEKTILFFGGIKPYKGLTYLVDAFQQLSAKGGNYRLVIAGERKKGEEQYFDEIQRKINSLPRPARVIQKIQYISDEDTEVYFKAADVIALPYKEIFQSGILFLAYSFGLPVVASDVGSFRDDVVEAATGFLCRPDDAVALANALQRYFDSDLFKDLNARREQIRAFASARHSWDVVGEITKDVYARLLAGNECNLSTAVAND
jgi:glycosyltransferase involved in cell wall biosynthesis